MTDPQQMMADFGSHHIEGFAREAIRRYGSWNAARFDCPLISHIEGNLWMGGTKPIPLPISFKHVVSLYEYEEYAIGEDTVRKFFDMYDAAEIPTQVEEAADYVVECVKDGPTLVKCQAGLNRSGLVTALALIKTGKTPCEAIDLLREKRSPLVLCNETFENWLREYDQNRSQ